MAVAEMVNHQTPSPSPLARHPRVRSMRDKSIGGGGPYSYHCWLLGPSKNHGKQKEDARRLLRALFPIALHLLGLDLRALEYSTKPRNATSLAMSSTESRLSSASAAAHTVTPGSSGTSTRAWLCSASVVVGPSAVERGGQRGSTVVVLLFCNGSGG